MKHFIECEFCGIFVDYHDVVNCTRRNNKRKRYRYVQMCPECWEKFNFPIRLFKDKKNTTD